MPPATGALPSLDRQTIAQVVERVLATRGISRGSAAKREAAVAPVGESECDDSKSAPVQAVASASRRRDFDFPSPATASAEERVAFTPPPQAPAASAVSAAVPPASGMSISTSSAAAAPAKTAAPAVKVAEFVSESDVRVALTRGEKIHLGPKTIITPAARDLASAHEVFVAPESRG